MNHPLIGLQFVAVSTRNCRGKLLVLAALSAALVTGSIPSALAVRIAAGNNHSLLIKEDSSLWSWGDNFYGQLGDGTKIDRAAPVKVAAAGAIADVAGGSSHSVAVRSDGTVLAWGANDRGQIGDGTDKTRSLPIVITGVSPAGKGAAVGLDHSLVLKVDGGVAAWGANDLGQLGNGNTTDGSRPSNVVGLTSVKAIAAGYNHSMAVRTDGTLWTWGWNADGQLGDGTTTNRLIAAPVRGFTTGVIAAAGGYAHSLALLSDGRVWTWGRNEDGQLGTGSTAARSLPSQIQGLTDIVAIAAGFSFSVALRRDGTVFVWGYNRSGELGLGTTTGVLVPTPVTAITSVIAIAAGDDHMLLLKIDGTMWAAGDNLVGQLGDGSSLSRTAPTLFATLTGVESVSAGGSHTLAVRTDGTAWGWGYNAFGQLGDGTTNSAASAKRIGTLTGVKSLAGGYFHTLALTSDGTVSSWGGNAFGELGDGTTKGHVSPAAVPGLTGMTAVVTGQWHSAALKSDGTVWVWGRNNYGQLGDGTTTSRSGPVKLGLTGVVAIAAGAYHTLALLADGTVRAWGFNLHGQVGDGTIVNRLSPVTVSGLNGVTAIAAGGLHSMALRSDRTVRAWGNNVTGQVGDGTTVTRTTPVVAFGAANITSIAAGGYTSYGLRSDGAVLAWGRGGMTGSAVDTDTTTPTPLKYVRNIAKISSSLDHTVAVTTDGRIFSWGSNVGCQLGIGYPQRSANLVRVKDTLSTRTTLKASFAPAAELKATAATPGTFDSGDIVVEFFNPTIKNGAGNPGIGHYFMTASAEEATSVGNGGSGPGWQRTGRTFRAWIVAANAPVGAVEVCRFYAAVPNSHFYTASAAECQGLRNLNPTNNPALGWSYEGIAFYTVLPTAAGCPAGNYPIYRSYNNRFSPDPAKNDGNHRITPSYNDYLRSVRFFGYADEGIAFCAPASPEAGADLQTTYVYPGPEVAAGATIQADFIFNNNGPGKGDGGVVHAALPPAVTNWTISCTARNGASCPTSLNVDRLREGQSIATWPAGGGFTVTAVGTAPVAPDSSTVSLEFASASARGNGAPDPTPDNDSPPSAQTTVRGGNACTYTLNPAILSFAATAGSSPISIAARSSCNWTALSDSSWLTVGTPSGSGNATMQVSAAANAGAQPRTGTINVSGSLLLVVQGGTVVPTPAACANLQLQREGDQTPALGLSGPTSFGVFADGQCSWSAQTVAPWVSLAVGGGGNGNGSVSYLVQPNEGEARSATIMISGKAFVINQLDLSAGGGGGGDGGGDSGGGSGGDSGGSSGGDSG